MLSNKLTFSLVFLVMFAVVFAITPALAQQVTAIQLNDNVTIGTGLDPGEAATVTDRYFTVLANDTTTPGTGTAGTGILTATNSSPTRPITAAATNGVDVNYITLDSTSGQLPDLNDFFARGGTIELLVPINPASEQFEQADARWHDAVITEIMWGLDEGTDTPNANRQWIEIYNNTGSTKGAHNHVYRDIDGRGDATGTRNVGGYGVTYDADGNASGTRTGNIVLLLTVNTYFGSAAHADVPTARQWISFNNTTWTGYSTRPATFTGNNHSQAAATDNMLYYKVVDRVSNMGRGGRQGPLPGQGGRVAGNTGVENNPSVSLISAYRKRHLLLDDATGVGTYHDMHKFENGTKLGGWMASWVSPNLVRRINITQEYIATPGSEHFTPVPPTPTVVPVNIVFNEIRNDTSEDDLDWIELYNNSSVDVDIGDYEISIVTAHDKDDDLIQLQDKDDDGVDIKLGAGEYLLIVNRDPEDSIIANGKDITINASNRLNLQGAEHLYYFPKLEWQLPNTGDDFLLILRNKKDKNKSHEAIQDIVGDLRITDLRDDIDTKVWPLKNWGYADNDGDAGKAVGEKKDADTVGDGASFGSKGRLSKTWYRAKYEAGLWWHQDHWKTAGYMGGIGYRKDLGDGVHLEAPGTPGYVNSIQGTQADYMKKDAGAEVTISEVMYDAGRAWDLVQWIELYNSSMTEAVDISGWTLDIRNAADDEEPQRSFVDDEFEFEAGTIIPPNRTLLIVSATGATNVPANRVYDLFAKHGNELGLKNLARRTYLLSKTGFRLQLMDDATEPKEVDTVGNATLEGARVTKDWDLPEESAEGEARHSIIRLYGAIYNPTRSGTGYEMAGDGTMEESWNKSGLESGNIGIYYGHTDDFSTPGFRRGAALPVSLSSFRPVRDKATGEVLIRWITASELNNAGFNILRSETKTGNFKVINVKGIIPGHGTTSEKHVYEWTDTTAKPNVVYYYQIEDVSFDGERATLATTHLRGNVNAAGKVTTTWGDLKSQN